MSIDELVAKIIAETKEPPAESYSRTREERFIRTHTMPEIHIRNIELSIKTLILDWTKSKIAELK